MKQSCSQTLQLHILDVLCRYIYLLYSYAQSDCRILFLEEMSWSKTKKVKLLNAFLLHKIRANTVREWLILRLSQYCQNTAHRGRMQDRLGHSQPPDVNSDQIQITCYCQLLDSPRFCENPILFKMRLPSKYHQRYFEKQAKGFKLSLNAFHHPTSVSL